MQLRPGVIEHERQDEFLDQPKHAQILVRRNLVEDPLLLESQCFQLAGAGQAFRQEPARKIEIPVFRQHVVELQAARSEDASVAS